MENDKRWQDKSGSSARGKEENENPVCYSAEDLKRLFEVGGVDKEQLVMWIGCATNLIRYMFLAGYTPREIEQRLGIPTVKIGKKERLLYEKLMDGTIKPTDTLNMITEKMKPYYKVSRQSWAIAIQKLEKLGFIR